MKRIPLTKGKFALVDNEDYDYIVAMGKWKCNNSGYAVKSITTTNENGKIVNSDKIMHRIIMNCPKGVHVDHINGNGLDNRKSNLRLCSIQENSRNRGAQRNNTTGFKGVVYEASRGMFKSRIQVSKHKRIHLGYFKNPKEAARAYNEAAIKYHGEFAKLNEL